MENNGFMEQLFLVGLLKGEKQWSNIPLVVRVAIKSFHDILVQQQKQIDGLVEKKKTSGKMKSIPHDIDSKVRYIIDEHLPRHTAIAEVLNPLKMKTYQLENKMRQKANSLDVANLLKTKLDAEAFENQIEQLKLEWDQQMKGYFKKTKTDCEKKINEKYLPFEEQISTHNNQLKDLLPRFEILLRNWGKEKTSFRSQFQQIKEQITELKSSLNRKIEVKEVSLLLQQRVQLKGEEIMKRTTSMFETERSSLTALKSRIKENIKQIQEDRTQQETNLAEKLSSKVEVETVNSWIEKHTNELNGILKRIRDVELNDIRGELKSKVSIDTYRSLLIDQEKIKGDLELISKDREKQDSKEREIKAAIDQLKHSCSGFSSKLASRVTKVEYLQDLGKLKGLVENEIRGIKESRKMDGKNTVSFQDFKKFVNTVKTDIQNVVDKYMSKNQIEIYFEERLSKLRKSIETLHRSIGQLLIINKSVDTSGILQNNEIQESLFQNNKLRMSSSQIMGGISKNNISSIEIDEIDKTKDIDVNDEHEHEHDILSQLSVSLN